MLFSCRSRNDNEKAEAGLRMPQGPPLSASQVMCAFGTILSSVPPGGLRKRCSSQSAPLWSQGPPPRCRHPVYKFCCVFTGSSKRITPTTRLPEMLRHKLIPEMWNCGGKCAFQKTFASWWLWKPWEYILPHVCTLICSQSGSLECFWIRWALGWFIPAAGYGGRGARVGSSKVCGLVRDGYILDQMNSWDHGKKIGEPSMGMPLSWASSYNFPLCFMHKVGSFKLNCVFQQSYA